MAAPETPEGGPSHSGETTMLRKARVGRAEHSARAMTLAKALRLSCAKVADTVLDLSMAAIAIRSETVAGEDVPKAPGAGDLLMLFDGPARSRAALACDPVLVGALIQQQTMAQVLAGGDTDEPRPPTRTDAAICAPFLDALLAHAAALAEDPVEHRQVAGFAFGAWLESPRVLGIALEAAEYTVIRLTLDIDGGKLQGQLSLILPAAPPAEEATAPERGEDAPLAAAQPLGRSLEALSAELRVALTSLPLSLSELGALAPDMVLELGSPDFGAVRLLDISGQTVSRGSLGQLDGKRALRIAGEGEEGTAASGFAALESEAELPATFEAGELPDLPDLPEVAEAPGVLEAAPLADLPQVPDLPDLPDVSDMTELPDLPDMSDLPELDALPDLPDLPDLNAP